MGSESKRTPKREGRKDGDVTSVGRRWRCLRRGERRRHEIWGSKGKERARSLTCRNRRGKKSAARFAKKIELNNWEKRELLNTFAAA